MTVAAQAISTGSATALALRRARKDLQNAVLMGLDTHRRRQYALSAQDGAATVLLAGDANAGQLRYARLYFTAAQHFSAAEASPLACARVNDCAAAS